MGSCCTTQTYSHSDLLDHSNVKFLLLGPCGSGKSTVFKQLNTIYCPELEIASQSSDDVLSAIHCQIIKSMQQLITIALKNSKNSTRNMNNHDNVNDTLDTDLDESIGNDVEFVNSIAISNVDHNNIKQIGQHLSNLWQNEQIQKIFSSRAQFSGIDIPDSTGKYNYKL